jgi:4-hydroxythreonine-4-phosphate dehydrogenase
VSSLPPLIVVSSGEPSGIGPDISLALGKRAFAARLAVLGDPTLLAARARDLKYNVALKTCGEVADVGPHVPGTLPILPVALPTTVTAGRLDTRNAPYVLAMLRRGAELCSPARRKRS